MSIVGEGSVKLDNIIDIQLNIKNTKPQLIKGSGDTDNAIITTGAVLNLSLDAWKTFPEKNLWSLYSMPLWGEETRLDTYNIMKDFKNIVTIEEHLLAGGFSSWLMESELHIKPITLDISVCGKVGSQELLLGNHGLNIPRIHEKLSKSNTDSQVY